MTSFELHQVEFELGLLRCTYIFALTLIGATLMLMPVLYLITDNAVLVMLGYIVLGIFTFCQLLMLSVTLPLPRETTRGERQHACFVFLCLLAFNTYSLVFLVLNLSIATQINIVIVSLVSLAEIFAVFRITLELLVERWIVLNERRDRIVAELENVTVK